MTKPLTGDVKMRQREVALEKLGVAIARANHPKNIPNMKSPEFVDLLWGVMRAAIMVSRRFPETHAAYRKEMDKISKKRARP